MCDPEIRDEFEEKQGDRQREYKRSIKLMKSNMLTKWTKYKQQIGGSTIDNNSCGEE